MSTIRYDKDDEGVVTLTLDAPGAAVNTMDAAFQHDLAATIGRLEAEKPSIRGVLLPR